VLDARRGEVFTRAGEAPVVLRPDDLDVERGARYVGDGAVRYRGLLEARGGVVPEDESGRARPVGASPRRARRRVSGPAERVRPLYLRDPDAERSLREGTLRV
jgi:tRNA A37 threonylcarbamoyladenosine modification protein TsaB